MGRKAGTKYQIKLTPQDRENFLKHQRKGIFAAKILRRERILLLADEGLLPPEIAKREKVTIGTVYNAFKYYLSSERDLSDRPRSGRPSKITGEVKAYIIATACSKAPKGRSRWTLRLLASHVIQMELLDSISKDSIATILKKTN